MEIFSPLNQVVQGLGAPRVPVHKPPDPTRINTADETARPEADPRHMSQNQANSELGRLAAELAAKTEPGPQAKDPDRPAGPPPAFDISVLEQALDFKRTMALLEVERSQARDIAAVRPDTEAEPTSETAQQGHDRPETAAAKARDLPVEPTLGQASPQNQAQAEYEGPKVAVPGVAPE